MVRFRLNGKVLEEDELDVDGESMRLAKTAKSSGEQKKKADPLWLVTLKNEKAPFFWTLTRHFTYSFHHFLHTHHTPMAKPPKQEKREESDSESSDDEDYVPDGNWQ